MKCAEQSAIIKYVQKKHKSPTQIHQDLCETSDESAVSYGVDKRWCRESESCEGQLAVTVTTQEKSISP